MYVHPGQTYLTRKFDTIGKVAVIKELTDKQQVGYEK